MVGEIKGPGLFLFSQGANPITGGPSLMTSSQLNPTGSTSKYHHVGGGGLQCEFWRDANISPQCQGMSLLCSNISGGGFRRANILTPATRPYTSMRRAQLASSTQEICEGISWQSQQLGGVRGVGQQVALHSRGSCQICTLSDTPTGQKPLITPWSVQPHLGKSTKTLFV